MSINWYYNCDEVFLKYFMAVMTCIYMWKPQYEEMIALRLMVSQWTPV